MPDADGLEVLGAFLSSRVEFLVAAGMILVGAWNYGKWRKDRARARELRTNKPAVTRLDSTPSVSVLVAAWNEADIIEEHIASFGRLRYPGRELVLCAGGEDETFEIAERSADEHVTVLRQGAGEGKQHALQRCFEHSRRSIVLLTHGDSLLSDQAFERVLVPVINDGEVASTGQARPLARQVCLPYVRYRWFIDVYVASHQPPYMTGLLGRNAAIRRDVLIASGEFRTPVISGTDYHLAKRVLSQGHRIRNVPESIVETRYVQDAGEYLKALRRWLRNVVLLGLEFGAYDEALRGMIPSLLGFLMIAGLVVGPLLGGAALAGWILAWTHALLSRVRYLRFGELVCGQTGGLSDYLRLPVYAFTDFAAWAMTLLQYPVRSLRTRW